MPTNRPRHMVTETADVEQRLNKAARHFPALAADRKQLLLRLTEVGEQALERARMEQDPRAQAKARILARTRAITARDAEDMLAAREADWAHDFGA